MNTNRLGSVLRLQAVRYLFAGGSAFGTEYLSFLALYALLDVQLYVANSVSFGCGLVVSFLLNRGWTFKKGNFRHQRHHQFAMYMVLAAANLLLTNVIVGTLKHWSVAPLVAKLGAMCAIAVWNFFVFRLVIFRESTDSTSRTET